MCEYTPFTPGPPLSNCPLGYSVSQVRSAMRSWMDQLLNLWWKGTDSRNSLCPILIYQRLDFEDGKQCFSIGFYCFFGWHFLKKAFRWYLKSDGPPFFGVTIWDECVMPFLDEKHSSRKNGRMGWLPGWFFLVWHHLAALHQLRSKLAPCSTFLYMCHSAA